MTWILSKALCENLLSSPEPVAESSGGTCSDGEPFAQLNVMPTPHKFWRNDKTMDASSLSRFGLTLRLLTEDRGEELLTLFRAGFPVRTYPQQEKAQVSTESAADCGERWHASFARYDRDLCSWKTHQFSLLGGLDEYSETWPRWGLMLNGECWERPTLERPISESESGLWRSPTAQDGGQRGEYKDREKLDKYLKSGHMLGLSTQVRWPHLWPTPTARDSKSGKFSELAKEKRDSHSRGKPLNEQIGGLLNPEWVEWLMGWPIGWTELKPLVTAKFQEWQQQHSLNYRSDAA